MAAFADLVRFNPTLGGTTDFVYSAAIGGCQSPALAGVQNGVKYKCYAVSNDLTQWEVFEGAYNSGTTTFPRTTVLYNSSGTGTATGQSGAGTKINFTTVPQVAVVGLAEDLISVEVANSFTATQIAQALTNLGNASSVVPPKLAMGAGARFTTGDVNTLVTDGFYFVEAACTNQPQAGLQYYLMVQKYPAGPNYCQQTAWDISTSGLFWTRDLTNSVWGAWHRIVVADNNLADLTNVNTALNNIGGVSFAVGQGLNAGQKAVARANIAAALRGHLWGFTLSTAGASTAFSVAAGEAADSTNSDLMVLAASLSKNTGAWAVGAAGSLDTGAIAASTWYHVYLIKRPDTGVVDIAISLSASVPTFGVNIPAAYTLFRRLGSMKINGSSLWTLFHQYGNDFYWDVPVNDVGTSTPSTTASLKTLSIPLGVKVKVYGSVFISTTDNNIIVSAPDQTDTAPGNGVGNIRGGASALQVSYIPVYCNASSQLRIRFDNTTGSYQMNTWGWWDDLGRSA